MERRKPKFGSREQQILFLLGLLVSLPFFAPGQMQRANHAKWQTVTCDSATAGRSPLFVTDGVVGNTNAWKSSGAGPHWAIITLPLPVTLGSAQLFLGADDSGATTNFSLQYLADSSWVNIPGASFTNNTATVLNVAFDSPVTASQLRFYSSDASVTVREIALFATNGAPSPIGTDVSLNVAKKCSITASSVAGTNFAKLAIDGYAGSDFGWWQTANINGPHTLEVTFPVATRIGSAHIYSGSATTAAVSTLTLEYWNGSAWVATPGGSVSGNTQKELNIAFTSPVSTTRVRLNIPGNGTQIVRELAVFAASTGITGYPLWTDVVNNDPPKTVWETFGDGFWSLINRANGDALIASMNGASQATPATNAAQQFQCLYNYDSDTFRLRNRQGGGCLSAQNAGTTPGASAIKSEFHNLPHELWRFEDMGGGYYRIVNAWSGLALQADGVAPTTVTLETASTNAAQQWQFGFQMIYPKKGTASYDEEWARFGASWNYIWSRNPNAALPPQVVFSPMHWNGASIESLPQYFPGWRTDEKPLTFLGFNEPDLSGQANMTVDSAISLWPQLEAADLPLASPATSWALGSWLTNFYAQADGLGYRVDYTAVHWYSFPSADGFINHLQSIYNIWKRPIWITEFSSSGSGVWSDEDNYRFLAEFLWRAEGLDWLRRYAVYSFKTDPPANPWDRTSPHSAVFKADGVTLNPFGELYVAWDGDRTVREATPYLLHNKGASFRIGNSGSTVATLYNIRVSDVTVQWQLVPAPTNGRYYLQSLGDGRRLRWNGTTLDIAATATLGTAVEWTYALDSNGYYFIDHPATGQRLRMNRVNDGSNAPTSVTLLMTTAGTVNDNTRWRFIKPYVPITLKAAPGDGLVALSWTGFSGATNYAVKRSNVSGGPYETVAETVSTNVTDVGLSNGSTYYYVVATAVPGGSSQNSSEISAQPQPRAYAVNSGGGAVGPFAADSSFTGGSTSSTTKSIDLTGVADAGAPESVYQTQRHGNHSYTFAGLTLGANYKVRLHFAEYFWTTYGQRVFNVAINGNQVLTNFDIIFAAGASGKAVIRDFTTTPNGSGQIVIQFTTVVDNAKVSGIEILLAAPAAPTGLIANSTGNSQITLNWNPAIGATSYAVKRANTNGGPYQFIASAASTNYSDTGLSNGVTYYYVVSAVNAGGESLNSNQAGTVTPPVLVSSFSGGGLTLSWPATAGGPQLYSAPSLSPPIVWTLVTNVPVEQGSVLSVSVPIPVSDTNRFFRLKYE